LKALRALKAALAVLRGPDTANTGTVRKELFQVCMTPVEGFIAETETGKLEADLRDRRLSLAVEEVTPTGEELEAERVSSCSCRESGRDCRNGERRWTVGFGM
jgi:hypothetical protein